MLFRSWGCFVLLFIGLAEYLIAQEKSPRFQHLTIENGLPQNRVDCILKDSQGFMWFGTWNGLCRYDGYNIEVFNKESGNINALRNNFIYVLNEDHFGNIWVGTKEGLYVYLYNQHGFRHIASLGEDFSALTGAVSVIEKAGGNSLWVGTDQGAMQAKVLDNKGTLEILQHYPFGKSPEALGGKTITSILNAQDGSVWIGTDEGIHVLQKGHKTFTRFSHDSYDPNSLSFNSVYCIYQDSKDRIWVGTENGLNLYNKESNGFRHFFHQSTISNSLVHNAVTDIAEDKNGNIFISTLGGMSEYLGENNFRNYVNELKSEHSLNSDFLSCLLADDQGTLWIGTERGGVNIYNTYQNVLEYFEFEKGNPNSLSHNTINSIYEDDQYIWIGTAGGGLNRYDKLQKTYQHYLYNVNEAYSISSDFVTAIHRDKKNRLWVATWGSGLNLLVNEDASYFINNWNSTHFQNLTNGYVAELLEDEIGNLWIGTLGGLFLYNMEKSNLTRMSPEIEAVGCLALDNEGHLWVGSPYGLYHVTLDTVNGNPTYTTTSYKHDPEDSLSLSGNYVIAATKDHKGNMWFGTYGQGINKLVIRDGRAVFESYTKYDGIANDIVYGIIEDDEQQLWLSTDNGLTRFDPITKKARNLYMADGLLNNQYYWSAHYKNDSGKLYFGGMNGLNTFYPSWISNRNIQRTVAITDLKVYNESVMPSEKYQGTIILQDHISKVGVINLSYKSKAIAFEFSALDYNEQELIKYAYFLQGFDEDWNYVEANRRFANYTNLKPGEYTFMVKASDLHGDFTSPPTTIALSIAPPFWETLWFRIASLAFLSSLIIGYNRYRVYNLKKQKLLLEQQVKERTEKIKAQNLELSRQADRLQASNYQLEKKQLMIEGQNEKLEQQNWHILQQRNKLIALNKKVKLVSQLRLSFFTNVSHEFRTPLTLIIGPLERLLKGETIDHSTKATLELINRNAQRLLHLVNQIMDFKRIEKSKMELKTAKGDINLFCQNIFNAFRPLAEVKKIDFQYEADESAVLVWFDHYKMEDIIYNLLSNAFKYTQNKGKILLELRLLSYDNAKLNRSDLSSEQIISIRISDSGIGISRENLPLVFKRFYRVDSEEVFQINGSGIGLALAEEYIKAHHGDIFVESRVGEGSIFEIQFPAFREGDLGEEPIENDQFVPKVHKQVSLLTEEFGIAHKEMPEKKFGDFDKNKPIALIVEDNFDLRQFMIHCFAAHYNIIEAENGKEGLQNAREMNPDIIISDVMMPEMNGLELCSHIKSDIVTSHIPVILLTAKSEVENKIEGLEKGADDYLPKPFNFELLEARVRNLIASRKQLRQAFLKQTHLPLKDFAITQRDQKFLEQAIKIVENEMADPAFGVQEFVKMMGVSRSLLHKKLTALTDQSATEFINHLRLKKALHLLQNTDMNISEIAYSVGYNDPKYFSRVFSKQYGESPSEYMNKVLNVTKGLA